MMSERFRAVLFDMDGLMLDTERIFCRSQQEAARRLGFEASHELMVSFVGLSAQASEIRMHEAAGNGFDIDEYRVLWPSLWRSYIAKDGAPLKEGLLPLLDWLRRHEVPRAVVTSSMSHEAALALLSAGIDGYFEHVVTGDQVARMKPAPDIYLLAAQRVGVEPSECVAFEDSDAGVLSASSAGMRAVQIPDLRQPSDEARRTAFCVLSSLTEALPLLHEWIAVW